MFELKDPLYQYYLSYCYLFLFLLNILLFIFRYNEIILFISLLILSIFFIIILTINPIKQFFQGLQAEKTFKINGLMYFFTETFSFNLILFVFAFFNYWNPNDTESLRYLISALIQSEAAIISIIITLSLIGIQIISQKYSTYATDIFKKYPDIWIVLSIYLLSILIGVFSLLKIFYENSIFLVIFFFTVSLLSLGPYIWNMMTIYRPENILASLKFKIINTLPDSQTQNCSVLLDSNIIAMFDILWTSINNHDSNTYRKAFLEITLLVIHIPYDNRLFRISLYAEDYIKLLEKKANYFSKDEYDHISNSLISILNMIEGKKQQQENQ